MRWGKKKETKHYCILCFLRRADARGHGVPYVGPANRLTGLGSTRRVVYLCECGAFGRRVGGRAERNNNNNNDENVPATAVLVGNEWTRMRFARDDDDENATRKADQRPGGRQRRRSSVEKRHNRVP